MGSASSKYAPTAGVRVLEFERDVPGARSGGGGWGGNSKLPIGLWDVSGDTAYVCASWVRDLHPLDTSGRYIGDIRTVPDWRVPIATPWARRSGISNYQDAHSRRLLDPKSYLHVAK